MVRLGAHPRLAAMMLAAGSAGERALAADLAALLEERDPMREAGADVGVRLGVLRGGARGGDADRGVVARVRQGAAAYRRRLGVGMGVEAAGMRGGCWRRGFRTG